METRSSLTPGTTLPNLGMPGPAGPALLAGRRRGVGGEPPFSQQGAVRRPGERGEAPACAILNTRHVVKRFNYNTNTVNVGRTAALSRRNTYKVFKNGGALKVMVVN